jgi:hypothetical protein
MQPAISSAEWNVVIASWVVGGGVSERGVDTEPE